ncbi:MAG: protein kinase domain-containing protein, partial [Bradymonadaceae bacterium]
MKGPRELVGGTLIKERYEVRDQLGSGGFATVYRAFDVEIERVVAVKVLDLALLKNQQVDNVLARFRQEAKLAARIRHPGVVQIFDFGVLDDGEQPFIVMEYLEGRDLEVELMGGPMSAERALPLFCHVLDALG